MSAQGQTIVEVAKEDVPHGRPHRVKIIDRSILVIREGDEFFVFHERCPHQGLSMRNGVVVQGRIVCPYHQYQFDLRSGESHARRCEPATKMPFEDLGDRVRVVCENQDFVF